MEWRGRISDRLVDGLERSLILLLYIWLVARILAHLRAGGMLINLLMLQSEGLVVMFMLIRRRASEISRRPGDWAFTLMAICTPLFVSPVIGRVLVPPVVAALLMLMGIIIQAHAKLILGRSFGCVAAHRGLKLTGPYRIVRHPMYMGYLMTHMAFLFLNPSAWNLTVYAVCYAAQIPRLLTEERLLSQDPRYREYQAVVRHRLIPRLF